MLLELLSDGTGLTTSKVIRMATILILHNDVTLIVMLRRVQVWSEIDYTRIKILIDLKQFQWPLQTKIYDFHEMQKN